MCAVKFLHGQEECDYDNILKAWQAINGLHSENRYLFVGHLKTPLNYGEWMAYLRRPDKGSADFLDVPFNYEGFSEEGAAENAVFQRGLDLGWRIREIDVSLMPQNNNK